MVLIFLIVIIFDKYYKNTESRLPNLKRSQTRLILFDTDSFRRFKV
nr:MAG TPA: hypothetical protein [Caudoviricetes sp.]